MNEAQATLAFILYNIGLFYTARQMFPFPDEVSDD
jgi:hypothetical protein